MQRDLQTLASQNFDVIVVGGGIAGISVARDAALRGLSVALVERDDFASGSTGRTFGMIGGDFRCRTRSDLSRLRALSTEQNALLRIAPHLVNPVAVAVPTYGHGRGGKLALRAGMALRDLLTTRRNEGIADPSRRLPASRTIGRDAVLESFSGLSEAGLTGAAICVHAQIHHPARLALALLRAAVDAGAQVANGLEATGIVRKGITVTGVGVRATESGEAFVIRGRTVVNTAGAWAERILEEGLGVTLAPPFAFSRRISLVVDRRPTHGMGLALLDDTRDADTPSGRGRQDLFVLPWRDRTILGDWHGGYAGTPDDVDVTDEEVEACVGEINERHPGLRLHPDEVVQRNAALGLEARRSGATRPGGVARSRLVDHSAVNGTLGIISLVGSEWGTARMDAARVVDHVFRRAGTTAPASTTAAVPVHGGDLESLDEVVQAAHEAARPWGLTRDRARTLVRDHGTGYKEVFELVSQDRSLSGSLPGTRVLRAEVVHAVRMEMAQTLGDLVHRRTGLGLDSRARPAIEEAAYLMSMELGWSTDRTEREVAQVVATPPAATSAGPEHARL